MDGSKWVEAQADRHWSGDDFDESYLEWCEENEVEPEREHHEEWLRDREEDRAYDAYRDDR